MRMRVLTGAAAFVAASLVVLCVLPAEGTRGGDGAKATKEGLGSNSSDATLTLTSDPEGPVCIGTAVTFTATHSCSTVKVTLKVTGGDPSPKEDSADGQVSVTVTADTPGTDQLEAVATSTDGLEVTLRVTVVCVEWSLPSVIRVGKTKTATANISPSDVEVEFDANTDHVSISPTSGSGEVTLTLTGESVSGTVDDTLLIALPSDDTDAACESDPFTIYDISISGSVDIVGGDGLVPDYFIEPVPSTEEVVAPLLEAREKLEAAGDTMLGALDDAIATVSGISTTAVPPRSPPGGPPGPPPGVGPPDFTLSQIMGPLMSASGQAKSQLGGGVAMAPLDAPELQETPEQQATFTATVEFTIEPAGLEGTLTVGIESDLAGGTGSGSVENPDDWEVAAGTSATLDSGTINP